MSHDALIEHGPLGRITLSPAALTGLVRAAAETVEGVRVRRARKDVAVEAVDGVRVSVAVAASIAEPLPATGERVQAAVGAAFEATTGRRPVVDVTIDEVTR